jgi:hypothetical protein
MMSRLAALAAAVVALSTGAASAAPVTLENRAQLVAARMNQGGAYDQATRAIPLPARDEQSQAIAARIDEGSTYRQARLAIGERAEVVNARWTRHQLAMVGGATHDAGWTASAAR